MRVLARLLGSNIGELVERIAGGGKDSSGGARPPDMQERVLCARLLASMAQDDEHAAALLAGDATLARRLVGLLPAAPLVDTEAAVALLQVLHHVADGGPDAIVALEEAGAVPAAVAALVAREGDAPTVAEAVAFLAAMVDCPEMVALLDAAPAAGGPSPLSLALRAVGLHQGNDAVAVAGLSLVERAVFFEHSAAGRDFGQQGACVRASGGVVRA